MNDNEQQRFEDELRRTPPAQTPHEFLARLKAAKPAAAPVGRQHRRSLTAMPHWWRTWCWLAPALGAAVAGLLVVRANFRAENPVRKAPLAANLGLKADDVQVDQELISTFDVVAKLPGGEPVRFRCRKWNDQLVVTDRSGRVQIEQDSPRVEVIPVRFETY